MLTTENSGGVVAGAGKTPANPYEVVMLKGTRVKSVDRDVKAGETIFVNEDDYRFLVPYGFAKDVPEFDEAELSEVAPDNKPVVEQEADTEDDSETQEVQPKVVGRRRQ